MRCSLRRPQKKWQWKTVVHCPPTKSGNWISWTSEGAWLNVLPSMSLVSLEKYIVTSSPKKHVNFQPFANPTKNLTKWLQTHLTYFSGVNVTSLETTRSEPSSTSNPPSPKLGMHPGNSQVYRHSRQVHQLPWLLKSPGPLNQVTKDS